MGTLEKWAALFSGWVGSITVLHIHFVVGIVAGVLMSVLTCLNIYAKWQEIKRKADNGNQTRS